MRTLGIDLAAQDKKTAMCAVEWTPGRALVERPVVGAPEVRILNEMQSADWIGIDAPFGWPDTMVEAIHAYAHGEPWPSDATPERLRYRLTDQLVHDIVAQDRGTSIWPLSVSSDRIAVCAWRCARMLSRYSALDNWQLDRVGVPSSTDVDNDHGLQSVASVASHGIVEVYPAAALALWGLPHKGYKTTSAATATTACNQRGAIVGHLERTAGSWLLLSKEVREACIDSDDAMDALISSLVACAAATGRTCGPSLEQLEAARREGWIHLPSQESLFDLAPGTVRDAIGHQKVAEGKTRVQRPQPTSP